MAEISMDVSEYQEIMKNKELLEASLKREKELHEQLDKLHKEKIQALEDAKMKVVKVNKSETTEWVMQTRSVNMITRDLCNLLHLDPMRYYGMRFNTERLAEILFTKTKSHSIETSDTTLHGLDEVKAEIKAEYEASMSKKTKEKIEWAEKKIAEADEVIKHAAEKEKDYQILLENHTKLHKDFKALEERYEDTRKQNLKLSTFKFDVDRIVSKDYRFWNACGFLQKIEDLTNKL